MEFILMAVGGSGAALLHGLNMWRGRTRRVPVVREGEFAAAARAAVMYGLAGRFLGSLGNLAGGILVLNEVYPFDEYVRLRNQNHQECLGRTDAERVMGERFVAVRERWTDAQRSAVDRLEQAWPACEECINDEGFEADLAEFADIVLVTKLCRLLDGPITKNHAAIIAGFLGRYRLDEHDDKDVIIQFLDYVGDCGLLPNARETGARLCVLRATTMLADCEGDLRGLCESWGEEWLNHFPKRYSGDGTEYYHELYLWILAELFVECGREIPYLDLKSGVFPEALAEFELEIERARTTAAYRAGQRPSPTS